MLAEEFNPFNQAIMNCLENEYPESLIEAILTVSNRFGIEIEKASELLSPVFKRQLEEEYNIKADDFSNFI